MSTRKLIIAALLCGLAILVAFTVKMTTLVSNGPLEPGGRLPPASVTTTLLHGSSPTVPTSGVAR